MKSELVKIYNQWIQAWNNKDAKRMSDLLLPEAYVIGFDGSQMRGRDQVQNELTQIFDHYPTGQYVVIIKEILEVSSDVALLRSVVGMVPREHFELNPNVNTIQTCVFKKSEGRWQILQFQNTPAAFHGRPELGKELTAELTDQFKKYGTKEVPFGPLNH